VLLIDAHAHYTGDHPETVEWLERTGIKLLNVCVAHEPGDGWRERGRVYRKLAELYPDCYAWCTAIDVPRFDDAEYADSVIKGLKRDFADGAVACKLWKNIGMSVRRPNGEALLVDDPVFVPIFEFLADAGHTVLMHMAEPLACWLPLDESNTHLAYYTRNPQWHMHGRSDLPHHSDIMAARDRVVARHPGLRVVGAHLGSLEHDVGEMARRLDLYPNFAVDTSGPGRIVDLSRQDRDVVRRFFIDYQDRLMYGSDTVSRSSQLVMSAGDRRDSTDRFQEVCRIGREYYGTDRDLEVKGYEVHGLDLPEDVQEKLFRANAEAWYPGI